MKKSGSGLLKYLLPSLGAIVWLAVFFGVLSLGPRMINMDGDLGMHLTIGNYMIDSRSIPLRDVFSHTAAGQTVTLHEWLYQVIMAGADRLLGLDGIVLLTALVTATGFWLVYRRSCQRGTSVLPALLASVLAIAASSLHWLTRPHVVTFLFLALWLLLLDDLRRGRIGRWWLMPLVMLAWTNLHGGFLAGFATWLLYGVGLAWDVFRHRLPEGEASSRKFWMSYLLGGGTSLVVSLANPSGIDLWINSLELMGNRYLMSHTSEFQPVDVRSASTWPFLVMVVLLVLIVIFNYRRSPAYHWVPAAAWTVMAFSSARNIALFAIVATPLLAHGLQDWLHPPRADKKQHRLAEMDARLAEVDRGLKGFVLPLLAVIGVILGYLGGMRFDAARVGNDFDPRIFPVDAVTWLQTHPQEGEMFNSFTWGGYLLYRGWPQMRVFIDGQTDSYGEALTREYEQVLEMSAGWQGVLEKYAVGWAILPPQEPVVSGLENELGWQAVYADETAVILARTR